MTNHRRRSRRAAIWIGVPALLCLLTSPTDVNNAYIRRGDLTFDMLDGWWTDAGTFESLHRVNRLIAEARDTTPYVATFDRFKRAA